MNKENKTPDELVSTEHLDKTGEENPFGSSKKLVSQEVPIGVDSRAFLMRSTMLAAAAVMTGRSIEAQKKISGKSIAIAPASDKTGPAPPLAKDLNVVKKGAGPVLTTVDEFYKVGPGPSSSHTIGPMRITYDFYQRATKLPADMLAKATAL